MKRIFLTLIVVLLTAASVSAQQIASGNIAATGQDVTAFVPTGAPSIIIQVTGGTGTLTFQGSSDGVNYSSLTVANTSGLATSTTTTAAGIFAAPTMTFVRVYGTSVSATWAVTVSIGGAGSGVSSGGGGGDVNLTEVGGAAIALGQAAMAASLPVVIASNQSSIPVVGALAANGAAAATNRLGTLPCIVETTLLPTLTDGRDAPCYVDTNGIMWIRGGLTADSAAATSNRIGVLPAIVETGTLPTLNDGRDAALYVGTDGALYVRPNTGTSFASDVTLDTVPSTATGPYIMCHGASSAPTAVTTGRPQYYWCDLNGRPQMNVAYWGGAAPSATNPVITTGFPGTLVSGAITSAMTGTTSTSLVSGTGSNYLYITSCAVSNASTTVSTDILLQDGSGGTTLYVLPAPAAAVATTGGGGATHTFGAPLKVPTSGNALYAANVTTGSSTKISCNGYRSTVSY